VRRLSTTGARLVSRQRRAVTGLAVVAAILVVPAAFPLVSARAAAPSYHWLATWATSTTSVDRGDTFVPAAFVGGQANSQSVRSIVVVTSPGDRLRLRFSNQFGQRPVTFGPVRVGLQAAGPSVVPGSSRLVRFAGQTDVTIPPGAERLSDPVAFPVQAGNAIAVSMYVHGLSGPMTWHKIAHGLSYVAPARSGDQTDQELGGGYTTIAQSWFWMVGVEQDSSYAGTVVALGDSITDGYPIVLGEQHTWPGVLATRLQDASPRLHRAVVNAGIAGNRLAGVICNECGPSALSRLNHDALDLPRVTDLIVFEGTNDLGAGATATQVIQALAQIAAAAHQRGVRVIGATLTPRTDTVIWKARVMEPERQTVNKWIRTSGVFDGVIDFDAALRDPGNPQRLAPQYDSGDHLHPSAAGYEVLGDAVDVSLFA
jgi:lysophospholipase L1-like esterase